METDEVAVVGPVRLRGAKSALTPLLVEVDCYLHLLVLIYLKDLKKIFEPKNKSDPYRKIKNSNKITYSFFI